MHPAVERMLSKYQCHQVADFINALHEVIQEIALLGLWRGKFFEHAAFYGGTALRILYGLERFSEDLDFSLLAPNPHFNIEDFNQAIQEELMSFGFDVEIYKKIKNKNTSIQSAFIKAGTQKELIQIKAPQNLVAPIPKNQVVKIKFEVDIDPPLDFNTETKTALNPIPFSVLTYTASDLFSGKMSAILFRKWQSRVKGRDWYDLVWYVKNNIPLGLKHLQARLVQSGNHPQHDILTDEKVKKMLLTRIEEVDFNKAKEDVMPFLTDSSAVAIWSQEFFKDIMQRIKFA